MSVAKKRKPKCLILVDQILTGIAGLMKSRREGFRGPSAAVCGGAGSRKTLFAWGFVRGAVEFSEPGSHSVRGDGGRTQNVKSLGFDPINSQAEEAGYRLVHRIAARFRRRASMTWRSFHPHRTRHRFVGAKRIVLDTIEALFAGLPMTVRAANCVSCSAG